MNKTLIEKEIVRLKKDLAYRYLGIMSITFIIFMIGSFYTNATFLLYFNLVGLVLMLINYLLLAMGYSLTKLVRVYMIVMPFYNFVIICKFWFISVASLIWVISMPFWAYVFFEKKGVIWFTAYSFFHLLFAFFFAGMFSRYFTTIIIIENRYPDSLICTINLLLIFMGSYYKTKIRTLKVLSTIEEKEKITLPVHLEEEFDSTGALFQKIEDEITGKFLFKNPKLSLSLLSFLLNINNNYISKAIRNKGFNNFSHYINSHRISYVKTLIQENDLKKITLMYIYTEAGFHNQSTFNKVFKEIEGITPSEFVKISEAIVESE